MIIHRCEQRTPEWFGLRLGKFTASDFAALMVEPKKGAAWTDVQQRIIRRVAAERLTGQPPEPCYVSGPMQWGIDTEPLARFAYELDTGREVETVGFVELTDWIGCSPDGLIGLDGGLEIKCPNTETLLAYRANPDTLKAAYYWQCIGGMLCAERDWWDLWAYDPRLPTDRQSVLIRIERNEDCDRLAERLMYATEAAWEYME